MKTIKQLDSRGDTIIEVLIAVAVVSLILVASFTVANTSLRQIRMAQERGEALEIASASVESMQPLVDLPAMADLTNPLVTPAIPQFCIQYDASGTMTGIVTTASSDCKSGAENRYLTSISRSAADTTARTFDIKVTWESVKGTPENLVINYRVAK